jgi:hypothetical protein
MAAAPWVAPWPSLYYIAIAYSLLFITLVSYNILSTLNDPTVARAGNMFDIQHLKLQYITDADGEKNAVILPLDQFYQLLEDLEDLAVAAERRHEPTISHQELLDELS